MSYTEPSADRTNTVATGIHGNFKPGISGFPRIRLHDVMGRELDTFTSYQKAIYQAKWKFAQGEFPQTAEEWRLPHAPLPARPDFTRTAPPLAIQREYKRELRKNNQMYHSQPEFPDSIQADKGYENLRWSLQQVATLPALTAAHLLHSTSERVPPKTYLPFVSTAPIANREYTEPDKREVEYVFPGFCYGCTKTSRLCYGCERDPNPHYHMDKLARTGGGFVYVKRDKVYGEMPEKNPINWNVELPELEHLFLVPGQRKVLPKLQYGRRVFRGHPQWIPQKPRGLPPTSYVFYDDVEHPDFDKYGNKVSIVRLRDSRTGTTVEEAYVDDDIIVPADKVRRVTFVTDQDENNESDWLTNVPQEALIVGEDGVIRVDITRLPPGTTYEQYLPSLQETGSDADEDEDYEEGSEEDGAPRRKKSRSSMTTSSASGQKSRESKSSDLKSRESDGTANSGDTFGSKHRSRGLYKTPPPFQLKASNKQPTVAQDPFSTDRQYDIPTGDGFNIKKSDKPTTEFDEFRFGEGEWEQPKFETRARTEVSPSNRKRSPAKVPDVPRSKSDVTHDQPTPRKTEPKPKPKPKPTTKKKEVETEKKKKEEPPPAKNLPPVTKSPDSEPSPKPESAAPSVKSVTPPPAPPVEIPEPEETKGLVKKEKKQRTPVQKKERKQREPPVRKTHSESIKEVIEEVPEKENTMSTQPELVREPTPEPEPEPMVFKEHRLPTPPPMRKVPPPPLPRAAPPVPPLPREYSDPEKAKRELSQTMLEAPPPMFEPPKQRRPPPVKRPKVKLREPRLPLIRSTEPQTQQSDHRQVMDPLDYLAKYCIIHKDRLPHYEMVFNKVIREQQYRYADVPQDTEQTADDKSSKTGSDAPQDGIKIKTRLEKHEVQMIKDLTLINRSTRDEFSTTGYNIGDQNVQKVNFTLDTLIDRYEELQEKHDKMQEDRIMMMADIARVKFPEILKANYKVDSGKKKKKKGKKKSASAADAILGTMNEAAVQTDQPEETESRAPKKLTQVDIVRRLNAKMIEEISKEQDIARVNLEIERLQEKLRDVDDRIEDLEDEKKLLQLYSRDLYKDDLTKNTREPTMLRRQSILFQKMHPNEDPEMNLSELEEALQQINGHLITTKELQFIYHILDLNGRRRINRQMFCVVAALSEKVKQVDPFVRNLINKFNYEALNVKMDKSKELFWLLDGESEGVPSGKITANSLAVELAAGGVSPEHTQFVVNKFNRDCKGSVDFLDYLTYVPLFIELHTRIIEDPLSDSRVF